MSKTILRPLEINGYEEVVEVINREAHLHAIIAIHSSKLGPACGGIRAYPYASFDQALTDVLRLSKGMTYKSALAQTETGGAKSVIILDKQFPKDKEMLLAFADALNQLGGRYFAGEDVGITVKDLDVMRAITPYVVGLSFKGSSGDPSLFTARGGFRGIQAVCTKLWGSPSVKGKRIAIQGLGSVGMKLVQHLFWEGAHLYVNDINDMLMDEAVNHWGAQPVSGENIYQIECDVYSPCALGGILNEQTISRLNCKAIAGVANNQLLKEEDGDRLFKRSILYAPDFAINAGGLINISNEVKKAPYSPNWARDKVDHLYDLLLSIFDISEQKKIPTHQVAIQMADERLNKKTETKVVNF